MQGYYRSVGCRVLGYVSIAQDNWFGVWGYMDSFGLRV